MPHAAPGPPRPPLPPAVRGLGWTSFLTDLSSEAIYPLLPAFITRELGGSALSVGLIDGIANAVAAISRLPAGWLSDRIGRRPLILVGYGLSAIVRPLMGLVGSPLGALAVRATDRLGKGIRSAPRDALVTDLVEPVDRGRAFGHIRALDHLGAALGPLVALGFLWFFPGRERMLFLLSLIPGLATLAIIRGTVRDAARPPAAAVAPAPMPSLDRPQKLLLGCVAVWALAASSEQFLLLRAASLGVPAALVPAVWFGIGITKSLAARLAAPVIDRLSPRLAVVCGWLVFMAGYAGLALAGGLPAALAAMAVVAAGYGLIEPAERSLVAQLSPAGRQGASFGWYSLVQGLMAIPAGLLTGWLWSAGGGATAAFATSAALAGLAATLLALLVRPPLPAPGH
jgi:MFS family permease